MQFLEPSVSIDRRFRRRVVLNGKPRSLPIQEWSTLDRLGWAAACRPGQRLQRGGAASHLSLISRADIANRYGLFVDFLQRSGLFDAGEGTATLVTLANVSAFLAELKSRVSSVTVWNSLYKLRRAAQLIALTAKYPPHIAAGMAARGWVKHCFCDDTSPRSVQNRPVSS
jgi:hypothetical protein